MHPCTHPVVVASSLSHQAGPLHTQRYFPVCAHVHAQLTEAQRAASTGLGVPASSVLPSKGRKGRASAAAGGLGVQTAVLKGKVWGRRGGGGAAASSLAKPPRRGRRPSDDSEWVPPPGCDDSLLLQQDHGKREGLEEDNSIVTTDMLYDAASAMCQAQQLVQPANAIYIEDELLLLQPAADDDWPELQATAVAYSAGQSYDYWSQVPLLQPAATAATSGLLRSQAAAAAGANGMVGLAAWGSYSAAFCGPPILLQPPVAATGGVKAHAPWGSPPESSSGHFIIRHPLEAVAAAAAGVRGRQDPMAAAASATAPGGSVSPAKILLRQMELL